MRKNINVLNAIILFALAVSLAGCRVQAPQFKGIENVKLQRAGTLGLEFNSEAVFYNPNFVVLKVSDMGVDVMLDKKNVATIGNMQTMKVAPHTEFRVPLAGALNTKGTVLENLNSIFNIFTNKEVTLELAGDIKMRAYCFFKYHIPIKYEKKYKLNDLMGK